MSSFTLNPSWHPSLFLLSYGLLGEQLLLVTTQLLTFCSRLNIASECGRSLRLGEVTNLSVACLSLPRSHYLSPQYCREQEYSWRLAGCHS
ncbi:hypothetical protein BDZ97DRAFT_1788673 [Flammula alnicola]|nr:hypothetical protein BDZ97DRAFT_1788673 [Flammula alnicola]